MTRSRLRRLRIAAVVTGLALCLDRRAMGREAKDPRAVNSELPTIATHAYAVAPGYLELE